LFKDKVPYPCNTEVLSTDSRFPLYRRKFSGLPQNPFPSTAVFPFSSRQMFSDAPPPLTFFFFYFIEVLLKLFSPPLTPPTIHPTHPTPKKLEPDNGPFRPPFPPNLSQPYVLSRTPVCILFLLECSFPLHPFFLAFPSPLFPVVFFLDFIDLPSPARFTRLKSPFPLSAILYFSYVYTLDVSGLLPPLDLYRRTGSYFCRRSSFHLRVGLCPLRLVSLLKSFR